MPMNHDELQTYLDQAESNSIHASDSLNAIHKKAFDYYALNPMGNEVKGQSKVKSSDVYDVIESDMPSHVRTFLGHNNIMKFTKGNTEREKAEAKEKTEYINFLIRKQPDSYRTQLSWLKGAEIYRYSAVNYGYEEEETVSHREWEGLSEEDFEIIKTSLHIERNNGADVDFEELKRKEKDGRKDVRAKITKTRGKYFVRYIDPERFVITKGATCEDDAELIGHDDYVTKSDLIGMGYSEDLVKDLAIVSGSDNDERDQRLVDQGGNADGNNYDWTGQLCKLETRYLRVDMDGDGVAERVEIKRVGRDVLEVEPFDHVPYAVLCAIPLPGQMIGLSRADPVMEIQDQQTALLRQTMMNLYQVNSSRMAANRNVNMDDLLTNRIGGVVRTKGDGNPLEHVAPLPTPYVGDKNLILMQYVDSRRAQRTGSLMANQSLDADKLHKETATRFEGIRDAGQAKVELVQRNFIETGYRKLFEGMLWMVTHFQDSETEIEVLGKPLSVNPTLWLHDQPVVPEIGLGAGDEDTVLGNMQALFMLHQQLSAEGSPLSDQNKKYNIAKKMISAMNLANVDDYFNNPEIPEDLLQYQVEQLQMQNMQMQQMLQQAANPLAEAEATRAQAKLIEAEAKQETEIAKIAEDQRQFNEELKAENAQKLADLEFKYNELAAKEKVQPETPVLNEMQRRALAIQQARKEFPELTDEEIQRAI